MIFAIQLRFSETCVNEATDPFNTVMSLGVKPLVEEANEIVTSNGPLTGAVAAEVMLAVLLPVEMLTDLLAAFWLLRPPTTLVAAPAPTDITTDDAPEFGAIVAR